MTRQSVDTKRLVSILQGVRTGKETACMRHQPAALCFV